MPVEIHPTAIVHEKAELGERVTIGPYSVIGENVTIGDDCWIGTHVLLSGETTLGARNRIYHAAAIGNVCQDLKYRGERTFVRIGDDNVIREYVTINSATGEGESTVVGNHTLLMAYVHIAHNCIVGDHVILVNAVNLAGHVHIHEWAEIGGVTPVHQFVRVGKHAFVGGGSRIPQDIPPYVKVAGNPAAIAGINSVGLRRRGFTLEQRAIIKKAYLILYRSHLNVTQAVERIRAALPWTPEVETFVDFVEHSERGIIR